MLTKEQRRRCREILNHYGFDCQRRKLAEELRELADELDSDNIDMDRVASEWADVVIMMYQCWRVLGQCIAVKVRTAIGYKIHRQIGRIEKEVNSESL